MPTVDSRTRSRFTTGLTATRQSTIETHAMQPLGQKLTHRLDGVTRSFRYRATGGDDQDMAWQRAAGGRAGACRDARDAADATRLYGPGRAACDGEFPDAAGHTRDAAHPCRASG